MGSTLSPVQAVPAAVRSSADVRASFIDFFRRRHDHRFVPSSPVVPHDDPTLLFTNAGMNQFKPIFLGEERRDYVRATNSQKCIRAGGKHNDLDDVGRSRRHHTFFEMLGNWSFGDYFKAEAIEWAWELLTKVWEIDPTRLHVSCYEGGDGVPRDTEAADLWRKIAGLPEGHIHFFGADNFWEMGETGPCGPCSEIYVDRTPDRDGGPQVNGTDPRVMEVWNLVFIQYNRNADRSLTPLPARHVDTGMGFERICQVLQGKSDNYATDLWTPLFDAIGDLASERYGGRFPETDTRTPAESLNADLQRDVAFRVIADHARMATFAMSDGATPSNKKRGAVLRSVIRRAVRYGYQRLNQNEPFLHKLVPVVVDRFGDAFPELRERRDLVTQAVRTEEADFLRTIGRGLSVFDDAAGRAASRDGRVSGEDLFNLHATHGLPADLTAQLADERGIGVDWPEYQRRWDEHVRVSGKGRKVKGQEAIDLSGYPPTDDSPKYAVDDTSAPLDVRILGWVKDGQPVTSGRLAEDDEAAVLLDRTPFYAEQGGQVSDVGTLVTGAGGRFHVVDVERRGGHLLHHGRVDEGTIDAGTPAAATIDVRRQQVARHHTATHLLNFALRRVLGDHVAQKGSLVDAERLRFDFDHAKAVTSDELERVESIVNDLIAADRPVRALTVPLAEAKRIAGVRAVFGEKYPDPVRVVAVGDDDRPDVRTYDAAATSVEFCGGTHLRRTGEAGFFKIVAEESVSKGVRRVTAVCASAAVARSQQAERTLRAVAQTLSVPPDDVPARVASMQQEIADLKRKLKQSVSAGAGGAAKPDAASLFGEGTELAGGGRLVVADVGPADEQTLRGLIDALRTKSPSHAILLGAVTPDEKVALVAAVSDDLIARGLKAGDWVRETAKVVGGGGGGRPQMAQAGGKDPAGLPQAIQTAGAFAREKFAI